MSDSADIIRDLRDIAAKGRPVAMSPAMLTKIAAHVEVADAISDEALAVAAGQDAAIAAQVRARAYRADAEAKLARAADLRRHQWWILAAQVVVFAVWSAGLWWVG